MTDQQLLWLLQLSDSNFPSGAFSHSFGFETYMYNEQICDAKTFRQSLIVYIQTQLTYTDGLACRIAYEQLKANSIEGLQRLNETLFALCLAKETREGTRMIGERLWKLCRHIYSVDELDEIVQTKQSIHPAIAFAAVGRKIGATKQTTVLTYLFTSVQTMVQNAVRGIPLGQTDGQQLLVMVQPYLIHATNIIEMLGEEELGAAAIGLEIAQMQHERLPVRLFMS
ncbi:urease accessory protein UreF [Geobacillus sp. FSL W8-0032]|uniref:Urease accessory protein UreF n=1 Tax=Geobacillus icigianus TaxID=1430331 RepID=A0ABU6BIR2_9BACL|nr:urease accessory protein UreF [Geobacillus icigianus]MEB3751742.1 Urease accessory protein UreF [Geobacillus icigianus]